jgi:hypothetical protein
MLLSPRPGKVRQGEILRHTGCLASETHSSMWRNMLRARSPSGVGSILLCDAIHQHVNMALIVGWTKWGKNTIQSKLIRQRFSKIVYPPDTHVFLPAPH